ncbi:MAG TPA: putative metalloprotease CJM1_0395 family protein [Cellvibrio sp.]|nr:putative metalloprotease CJM1_0395 family protein [Cellvibrio sp.]
MTSLSSIPSNYANAVTPYVPLGRQPVGQESSDLKTSSFKALEQPAASAYSENRRAPDDNPADQQQFIADADARQALDTQRKDQAQVAEKERLVKDQAKIAELAARDREVRAHEQAHAAVGGQFAGSPTYEFTRGPNGVNYAVSGEVSISAGAVAGDPEATIAKAQQIRAAATAPADPSAQDRLVAAAADKMEANARAELSLKRSSEIEGQERKLEETSKLQKAEEAQKAEKEEQTRKEELEKLAKEEQRQALKLEEERAAQSRAERIESFNQLNHKTFDINRHLVEIGVVAGGSSKGALLNRQA